MIKAFFQAIISIFESIWQVILFAWLGLHAFFEWVHAIIHPFFTVNTFVSQLALFVGSILFSPFPWWTAFFFLLIPMPIAIPILAVFIIVFIVSFAQSIIFL